MIKVEDVEYIKDKIPSNIPIVVEGKRDEAVLKKIGFTSIIAISGKTDHQIVSLLEAHGIKRVGILTDFDKEGNKRCKELTRKLQASSIKVDSFVRRTFGRKLKIKKIEELSSYTKFLDERNLGRGRKLYSKFVNKKKQKHNKE